MSERRLDPKVSAILLAEIQKDVSDPERARVILEAIESAWAIMEFRREDQTFEQLAYLAAGILRAEEKDKELGTSVWAKDLHLRLVRGDQS